MRYLLTLVLVMSMSASYGQSPDYGSASSRQYSRMADETSALMTDAMGQPFYPQQKYKWEGKVFFPDDYTKATITTTSGKVYRNIRAKINLLNNTLLFTDSAGREFAAAVPVSRLEFEPGADSPKIVFIQPVADTQLYQVLDSGKISLLKKITVTYKDQMPYGSTNVTRVFEQKYSYYAFKNAMLVALDRSKSAVMECLIDKSTLVDTFIQQQKLKLRKEDDLVKVFRFYNSL